MPGTFDNISKKSDKFASIFDQLISNNFITKDVKIEDMVFTIKTLSSKEYLDSDIIYLATLKYVPEDVIARARIMSNLAYAIISINGIPVHEENDDLETRENNTQELYKHLCSLPPWIIDELAKEQRNLMVKQNKFLEENVGDSSKTSEAIENF